MIVVGEDRSVVEEDRMIVNGNCLVDEDRIVHSGIMQLACYFAVIYQESTSDSDQMCGEVGKSAVGKFATQNTFRTFHRQNNVGLKLPNVTHLSRSQSS